MIVYDDKTEGILVSGEKFILPHGINCDDLTFKASYIVESNIICKGRITALFDLIVFGNVEANEIDVKGRFVCIGKCKANAIITYGEIWSDEIVASYIETSNKITVRALKAEVIKAEGTILVAQTLEIDNMAESSRAIICGETAFGSGELCSPIVYTGEPLDLDNGEEAVISKDSYKKDQKNKETTVAYISSNLDVNIIQLGEEVYKKENDFCGYLDYAISQAHDDEEREKFKRWKTILLDVEMNCDFIENFTNAVQLIWLSEIATSDYFRNWPKIDEMFILLDQHFTRLVKNKAYYITCSINSYSELLSALSILYNYGDIISEELYCWLFEQLISHLGLRPEFVYKRLKDKGWNINVK